MTRRPVRGLLDLFALRRDAPPPRRPEAPPDDPQPVRPPPPPLAKRLNRNALTVAAVLMGMTVITSIVVMNTGNRDAGAGALGNAIAAARDKRVVLLGGDVLRDELTCVGPVAVATLERYHFDVAVVGAAGLTARWGITELNEGEAEVQRRALARADRVVVIADGSKIGTATSAVVAPASRIDRPASAANDTACIPSCSNATSAGASPRATSPATSLLNVSVTPPPSGAVLLQLPSRVIARREGRNRPDDNAPESG